LNLYPDVVREVALVCTRQFEEISRVVDKPAILPNGSSRRGSRDRGCVYPLGRKSEIEALRIRDHSFDSNARIHGGFTAHELILPIEIRQDRLLNGCPRVLEADTEGQSHKARCHMRKIADERDRELPSASIPREESDSETHFPPRKDIGLVDILRLAHVGMVQ